MSSFTPSTAMFYTDIQVLRGLEQPVDYGSGIEYADGITDSLFSGQAVGLQIGLWLNGTTGCKDIISGALDKNIETLIEFLTDGHASKVFLRVGYEFDNPSFGYSDDPLSFQKAFIYTVEQCRLYPGCAEKVKFVWHSWAAKRSTPLEDFYPGDDFVDWIGVSIFDQFFPWSERDATRDDIVEVLEFAQKHHKPTMIAESTPFGGIQLDLNITQPYEGMGEIWNRWFQPVLDLVDEYDIGMWSYINCAWQDQPMWNYAGFGETRLSTNSEVMQNWYDKVLHGDRPFLLAGSLLECGESANLGLALDPLILNNEDDKKNWYPSVFIWFLLLVIIILYFRRNAKQNYEEIKEQREKEQFLLLIRSESNSPRSITQSP